MELVQVNKKVNVTDKEITCAKLHMAINGYFAELVSASADEVLMPCEICKYTAECEHNYARMKLNVARPAEWIFALNDDDTANSAYKIERYIANKAKTGFAL